MIEPLVVGLTMGLLGAGHCLGMCGGILSALSFGLPDANRLQRFEILFSYNIGRILSYTLLGFIFGFVGQLFLHTGAYSFGMFILRFIAGVLLVLIGLHLSGGLGWIRKVEYLGSKLWNRIKPLSDGLLPVKTPVNALKLGMVWGWLPCGLVYSALAYASVQTSLWASSATMFAFGLGTLPAVLLGGVGAASLKSILQASWFRKGIGGLMILFGVWTAFASFYHIMSHEGHHHDHHDALSNPLICLVP